MPMSKLSDMFVKKGQVLILLFTLVFVPLIFGCGGVTTLITSLSASPSTVVVGKTATITCAINETSGSDITYTYSWSANAGSFATNFGNAVTWTAPDTPGIYQIIVTVTGDDGSSDSASLNITVTSSSQDSSIIINSLTASPEKGSGGFTSTLSCSASYKTSGTTETTSFTYNWSTSGGTLSSTTGKSVTWTAPSTNGTYQVTVEVGDGTYTTTGTLNLLVTDDGTSDVINITSLSYDPTTIYGGDSATLTCVAEDSEGYTMTYAWSATAGTLASTVGESVTWTAPTSEGTYAVVVTVTDTASNRTQEILNIVVKQEIDPPVIDSVTASPSSIPKSTDTTVTCTAHDPNNFALTYAWSASDGSFGDATSASTTWTAPGTTGQYKLTVTVSNEKYSTLGNIYVEVTN